MKVYVVTKGEYSDYYIVGVAESLKDADTLKKHFGADNIEVFDTELNCDNLDEQIKNTILAGKEFYGVEYSENKNAYHYKEFIAIMVGDKEMQRSCINGEYKYEEYCNYKDGEIYAYWTFYVVARDKKHAEKIAQDKYAKLKAEKLGL